MFSGDEALAQAYGQLPMSFEVNEGQTDPQVGFVSRGNGYALFLTPSESVLSLQAPAAPGAATEQAAPDSVLSMQLVGASATPQVVGLDRLPGVPLIYRATDLYAQQRNDPAIEAAERRICARADVLLATSEPVAAHLRQLSNRPVQVLTNGVEFERFSEP